MRWAERGPDAGKAPELVDELLNRPGEHGPVRPPARRRQRRRPLVDLVVVVIGSSSSSSSSASEPRAPARRRDPGPCRDCPSGPRGRHRRGGPRDRGCRRGCRGRVIRPRRTDSSGGCTEDRSSTIRPRASRSAASTASSRSAGSAGSTIEGSMWTDSASSDPRQTDDDGAAGRAALDDGRLDRLRLCLEIGPGGLELGEQVAQAPRSRERPRLPPSSDLLCSGKSLHETVLRPGERVAGDALAVWIEIVRVEHLVASVIRTSASRRPGLPGWAGAGPDSATLGLGRTPGASRRCACCRRRSWRVRERHRCRMNAGAATSPRDESVGPPTSVSATSRRSIAAAEVPPERLCDLVGLRPRPLDVGGVRKSEDRCRALGPDEPTDGEHGANTRAELAQHVVAPGRDELVPGGRHRVALGSRRGGGFGGRRAAGSVGAAAAGSVGAAAAGDAALGIPAGPGDAPVDRSGLGAVVASALGPGAKAPRAGCDPQSRAAGAVSGEEPTRYWGRRAGV